MVQNNKVLTVSYGTFSCTLEGFEDSFGTMRVIAEYFRDLAADDRYFGAEPPQPDADMMARIAQREIARQVEARADSGGVHLRAAAALPATHAADPAPAENPAPIAEPAPAAEPEPALAAVSQPEPPVDKPEPAVAVTEPVAAPSTVPEVAAAQPVTDIPETDTQSSGAAPAETPADTAQVAVDATEVEAEADDALIDDVADSTAAPGVVPAADSIAAKLQRIRDVVARGTADADEEYTEDEHAEAFLEDAAEDISLSLGESGLSEDPQEDSSQDDIAWTLDHLDLTGSAGFLETEAATDESDTHGIDEDSLFSEGEEETGGESDAEDATPEDQTETVAAPEDVSVADPAPALSPARPTRARIVRVKRAQLEEALASGDIEEIEDEDTAEHVSTEDTLSAVEEAEMLRELAAVEAELRSTGLSDEDLQREDPVPAIAAEEGDDEDRDLAEPEPVAPAAASDTPAQESDISRLMAAADEKLGTEESESSRETYSRLRAAVAAAEAERAAGGTTGSDEEVEAYRDDLASVVRPRRPDAAAARNPRRPEPAARPAPLKLVAEQRVDGPEAATAAEGPVRPRRIASFRKEEAEFEGKGAEGGFEAYAQKSGAVELHELLEAAASYMSFVEGREQFSRPQLMNKVQQLGNSEFNREDGLRSFGMLLREGKIERTHSGRFTASGDIGFRPGQRAAG